jgi:two-component system phosphate regulon response regulator PhoB
MLPTMSGADICRALRDDPETRMLPVIMLTARSEESDKIAALNAGADDYVTKPFSPAELQARIAALLRRTGDKPKARSLTVGPLLMDLVKRKVFLSDEEIRLGPTEFRLLEHFMQHPGEVFSRDRLLELVWGKEIFVEERTVDVHIRRLRKALGDTGSAADPGLIRTVRSAGYALNIQDDR